jgi:hypothetical protein
LVFLGLTALVLFLGPAAAGASPPSPGYAAYSVQGTSNGVTHSFVVNESLSHGTSASSILSLVLTSSHGNLSYSRDINSSVDVLPYMPAITNQNLSYSFNSTTISATVSSGASVSAAFHGSSYSLSSYAFSVNVDSPRGAMTAAGTVLAFPSDLVYSVNGTVNGGDSFSITLLSTSLPLTSSSHSFGSAQATSVGLGAGAAITALALGLGVRFRKSGSTHTESREAKPDHWVD